MKFILPKKALIPVVLALQSMDVEAVQSLANPIRQVVTMLQDMQSKVTAEGKEREERFEAFLCYCKNSGGDLDKSISAAEGKIESLTSDLKASTESKATTEAELKKHQEARADAQDTMAKATSLREKESKEFAKVKADADTNIAALDKAVAALEKGMSGSFLQTPEAAAVRRYAVEQSNLSDAVRQELVSFLSASSSEGYAPQGGEITGILKQLGDEMRSDLADATKTENEAINSHESMMASKKKEVAALQAQIEKKMARVGRLGVDNAEKANDLEDTKQALAADQKFKKELTTGCDTKAAEFDEMKKTHAEELVALSETIKVLNDDDALELFGATLKKKGTSFLQVRSAAEFKARALGAVRALARSSNRPGVDLIALALQGQKSGFDKIMKMIDDMVVTLKKEQDSDDNKKEYCGAEIDKNEDKQHAHELSISDSSKAIEELKGTLEATAEEIAALKDGITKLDKSVAEATSQREKESEQHKALLAADGTAKEVLRWAQNRLNKFYNPALYVAPPKRELSEADQIAVNMGGTPPPTAAPGGIAGTGIGAFVQLDAEVMDDAAPPPAPEIGTYTKKSEESTGVIAMIDLLVKDLDKEMTESKVLEKDAQTDYEKLMVDAGDKRKADSESIVEKESASATAEESLESVSTDKKASTQELLQTVDVLKGLHGECDWLVKNHEVRRNARQSEVESLKNAKAVLSGADYSFVQVAATTARQSGFLSRN